MSVTDPKSAAVTRAQFNDLGPSAAGGSSKEMNLNLILDVAVTLALDARVLAQTLALCGVTAPQRMERATDTP